MEQALVTRVLTVDLFRGVTPEWVHAHDGDLRWLSVAGGQVIVDQGDAATDAFAVVSGQLDVVYRDGQGAERLVSTLGSGDTFGEIALLNGGVRTSMVRAVEPTELVAITGQGFRALLADHPGLAARVTTIAAMRLRHTSVVADALEHLGLSDRAAVAEIEPLIEWLQLPAGDVLFNEGEVGDSAYVVLQGRLRAVAGLGGDERIVGEIGRGEIVGEMAVLDHEPRNATVFALRDTHLARFPPAAIDVLLDRFPQVMLHVARTVLRRIRRPRPHRGTEEQLSITVVALANDGPARAFGGQLAAALGRFGRAEHVTSELVDASLGKDQIAQTSDADPGSLRLLPWLHDLEERTRFVVYEADTRPSVWSRRVLRQCDHVLFVAGSGDRAGISALEQQARTMLVGRGRPRTGLVLLHHPSTTLPRGTGDWLRDRGSDDVYHVRVGRASDIERLARILAGRAMSLVLSGGGARGFAHLGVLRALDELAVPIDLVGGTSIGAVIAVLPGLETPVADMPRIIQEQFRRVFDYTLPVASVISAKRIVDGLRSSLGDTYIEDLWLPYFCVSASLTRACSVIHQRGRLATAVRASVSIPGFMPPVSLDGDLLVDGGVIDNLPVREMRSRNARGLVIAVDVGPATAARTRASHGESLSGWTALWSTVRKKGHVPPIAQTVLRSMLVSANRDRDAVVAENVSDLYLDLDVVGCGPFDFNAVEQTALAGYEAARPRLAAWLANVNTSAEA